MNSWLLRGLGMAFVHVVTRVLLGIAVTEWPLHGSTLRWLGVAVVILAALIWAGLDGIRDARAHPGEEEEGADLTMRWLKAAVVAGLLAGAVSWLIGAVSDIALGENSLFFELSSGAAFTVLLVFVPAMAAVTVGRLIVRRDAKKAPKSAAPVAVGAGVGAAGAAVGDTSAWSHESEDESPYGFAEGPYSDEGAGYADGDYSEPQHDQAQHEAGHYDENAPTEVFEAVRPHTEDQTGTQGSHRAE
ncbi:B-4DMT family transporter [Rhodococcus spelaei]|uniref:B-4DMT family transporter n=1 Tax=Rhodococcus spelaei TaxID=2546320 RepID=UPI0015EFC4A2|nr:B-4DMT family transporter [Rhodococcus spelaei]